MSLMVGSMFFSSCYYDTVQELYPASGATCDTSNVSYITDVKPVLDANCLGCHSNSLPSGSISLEGYSNVQGVANSGLLYKVINHAPGIPAMPQGQPQLPSCQILKIKAWIDAGAAQN